MMELTVSKVPLLDDDQLRFFEFIKIWNRKNTEECEKI